MKNPSWKIRRSIILGTLLFCVMIIVKVVWSDVDTVTNQVALYGAFGLAGTVIGSYVFGAVWDDNNIINKQQGEE